MIGDCLHRVAACRESLTREEARAVMAEILRYRALALLQEALTKGFCMNEIDDDPDLNPIRDRPEFRRLAQAVAEIRTALAPNKK